MSEMSGNELLVVAAIRDELSAGLLAIREELGGVAKAQTEVGATSEVASAGLNRTGAAAESTGRKLTAADLATKNAAGSFRTLGMTVPKTAAALAIVAAGAVYMAAKFESSMTRVNTQAGATLAEVHRMSGALIAMAPSVGIGPDKLADSLYHVESAGFRGAQALSMVRAAARGAAIGSADLGAVTQAMIASIASGIGGVHGANDAMALLNRTVGIGDMKMQALAQAMATGILPSARSAGLQFEDVAASLATITDNATPANEAATRLRMTFALMSSPTGRAVAALASIGMSSTSLATDMRKPQGLLVALTDLQAHLTASGKTATQQNQVIEHAFGGGRTSGAILTLLLELDRLRSKYVELGTATERQQEFQAAWAAYTDTLAYKWHSLVAGLDSGAIVLGQRLMPAAKDVLDVLITLGAAVGSTIGWLDRNRLVVIALAAVITALLLPAILRTSAALATLAVEKVTMGLWNMSLGASALVASLNPVTLALAAVAAAGVYAWSQNRALAADAKAQADAYVTSLGAQTTSLGSILKATAAINRELAAGAQKAIGGPKYVGELVGKVQSQVGSEQLDASGMPTVTINGKSFPEVIADTAELTKQRDKLLTQAAAMRTNEAALTSAYGLSSTQVEALAQRYGIDLTGALAVVGPKFDDVMQQIKLSHDPAARAALDIAAMANSATSAADAVTALKDSLDALSGNTIAADQAAITFRDRIVDLEKALKSSKGSMSINSAAGRVARQAFDEAASSASQWAVAVQTAGGSTATTAAALSQAIKFLTPFAKSNTYAAQQVKALRSELSLLQGRIDALHGKHVTITVDSRGNVHGLPGGMHASVGDTAGVRSAGSFARSMALHSSIDGGLPGKRTITSSVRSWGLGSPWSDHATGRAYDLIGSNLGSYAEAARRAGAFAEFHGSGAGRHLHVAGDTPGPRAPAGGGGGGGGISIVVQLAPGSVVVTGVNGSPAELEAAVARGAAIGARRAIERARVASSTFGAH